MDRKMCTLIAYVTLSFFYLQAQESTSAATNIHSQVCVNWLSHTGKTLLQYDNSKAPAADVARCQSLCEQETQFVCRTVEWFASVCYLSNETALTQPQAYQDVGGRTLYELQYQRCAVDDGLNMRSLTFTEVLKDGRMPGSIMETLSLQPALDTHSFAYRIWCARMCSANDLCLTFNLGITSSAVTCELVSLSMRVNAYLAEPHIDYNVYSIDY